MPPLNQSITVEIPDESALSTDQKWRIQRAAEREFSTQLQAFLDRWRDGDSPHAIIGVDLPELLSVATARASVEDRIAAWHADPTDETMKALAQALGVLCGDIRRGQTSRYTSTVTGLTYDGNLGDETSSVDAFVAVTAHRSE